MRLLVDQIRANSWNCNYMGEIEREALKQCLIAQGPKTLEPLLVRLMPDGGYELVDGEHRWRIAKELGWDTLEVVVLDIDYLEAKARCVSSSILRGHADWFKLAQVVKQDAEAGVNVSEVYKNVLSDTALVELFSLDALVPKARLDLEEAVKKFSAITLSDLHMISQFPAYLQEELAEEYKTHPITSHSLAHTLNKYTKQTQISYTKGNPSYLSGGVQSQNGSLPEKFEGPMDPNEALRKLNAWRKQQKLATNPKTTQTRGLDSFDMDSCDNSGEALSVAEVLEAFSALLRTAGFCCECGRLYLFHFKDKMYVKNFDAVVQKENRLFEHIDVKPRTFLVHCNGCNSSQEITVDNIDGSAKVTISCRHCQPAREGALDVTTGDAVWFG
jgi:hypothetical protein